MNGKTLMGVICLAVGGLLLLNFLNINLGSIFSYIIPAVLLLCGYIGLKNGKKYVGSILLVIGSVLLLGKLGWLISLIIAVALIGGGLYLISNKKSTYRH